MFNGLYQLVMAIRGIYKARFSYLILYLSNKSLNNRLILSVVMCICFLVLI